MKLALACLICALSALVTASAAGPAAVSNAVPAATSPTNLTREPVVPGDLFTNTIGMELVKVGGFWAGKYEVTQQEFQDVMSANPSAFSGGTRPVDSVSWNDAMAFCARLTAAEHKPDDKTNDLPEGYFYTLPSESEWESLVADASLKDAVTGRDATAAVGSLGPNNLGLYDIRGNVMEFCLGDTSKPYRVLRGGSWKDRIEVNLRPEFRFYCQPDEKQNTFGFRVLLKKP